VCTMKYIIMSKKPIQKFLSNKKQNSLQKIQ